MGQEKRFGKRVAEPSSVQIVHELKLMALRQSLDAAVAREASSASPSIEGRVGGEAVAPSPSDIS